MRIAVYGWVEADGGSVASANHVLVERLLRRGNEVTLFGKRALVDPPGLRAYGNYRHEAVGLGEIARPVRLLTDRTELARALYNRLRDPGNSALVRRAVVRAHARTPFDALLFLGVPAKFAVPGLPATAWPQGPPAVEADAFRAVRRTAAVDPAGPLRYWALTAYHATRGIGARIGGPGPAAVICQSRWAAARFAAYGHRDVTVIPYPVDLDAFAPAPGPAAEPVFLHIGRRDPRKRLDLLLAAFARVRSALPGARLRVVGRPGYVPDGAAARPGVTYEPAVPRPDVVSLMRSAPVLVQTSTHETFGTAVAEALACGATCVVGPDNGTAQYVDDVSVVFTDYTPPAVAAAMVSAWRRRAADPGAAAASARAAAVRHFAADRVAAAVEDVLRARRELTSCPCP